MKKPPLRQLSREQQLFALAREVEERLNAITDPPIPDTDAEFDDWLASDGPAIREAERGNIEPLRQRYPRLAAFLTAAKIDGRKVARSPVKTNPVLQAAAADVPRIRVVLRDIKPTEKFNAHEIAAAIWSVDVDQLKAFMKPSGPSGKRSPKR